MKCEPISKKPRPKASDPHYRVRPKNASSKLSFRDLAALPMLSFWSSLAPLKLNIKCANLAGELDLHPRPSALRNSEKGTPPQVGKLSLHPLARRMYTHAPICMQVRMKIFP